MTNQEALQEWIDSKFSKEDQAGKFAVNVKVMREGWESAVAFYKPQALLEDKKRLDLLEYLHMCLNQQNLTNYGWRAVLSPNITRLILEQSTWRELPTVDLHDADGSLDKKPTCRQAIDAIMPLGFGDDPSLLPLADNSEVLYFGCRREHGHYLHARQRSVKDAETPLGNNLDGGLLPKEGGQEQGVIHVTYKAGWTAIAFWDRSLDSRGNSNSAFLVNARTSWHELLRVARIQWPEIFARFKFELKPAEVKG